MSRAAFDPLTDSVCVMLGDTDLKLYGKDAEMNRRLAEMLELAYRKGYAVRLSLVTYEGETDMEAQAAKRRRLSTARQSPSRK